MSELLGWLKINDLRNGSRFVRSTMPIQWQMLSSSVTEEYDHAGSSECDFAPSRSISTADSGMGAIRLQHWNARPLASGAYEYHIERRPRDRSPVRRHAGRGPLRLPSLSAPRAACAGPAPKSVVASPQFLFSFAGRHFVIRACCWRYASL